MRDYKKKADQYRLPTEVVHSLKEYCYTVKDKRLIHEAIDAAIGKGDGLHSYLFRHVTRTDWPWPRLEANGVPCTVDVFRLNRHRFYYELNNMLNGAVISNGNNDKTKA